MEIIITIEPDEENKDMAYLTFKQKGKPENMAVQRANARLSRIVGQAYLEMKAESDYISKQLGID